MNESGNAITDYRGLIEGVLKIIIFVVYITLVKLDERYKTHIYVSWCWSINP